MEFRLLGPVAVRVGGQPVDLGPRKQRLVLAVLALEVNQVVTVDRLVELAWPVAPPRTAVHAVRVCVSELRAVLGNTAAEIVTQGNGYLLRADPALVDAHRFRTLADRARTAADDRSRVVLLDEALALWTGPALAGAVPAESRDRLCRGLEEARLAAVEDRVDALLRLGRHRELLDELTGLVEAHPLRERPVGQLMLALYRSGRAGEALAAYRTARDRLAEELGIDPGADLRRLELAVLRHDPALEPPAPVPAPAPAPATAARPAQLPPAVAGFTGRESQLEELDALLPGGGSVVVAVVAGTAGVGKTALAMHWAHRVRDRFPDGQLYLDLRGYAPGRPVEPPAALAAFLRALGVPAEQIPADPQEAGGLYRTALAGRRVLVVLDNAASAGQVRPLLPGDPGCLVLVTSRDRLAGLVAHDGARRLGLDVLTPAEAVDLLAGMLGAEAVRADPDAAAELARCCGHLPLALRLAAADLADHPGRTLAGQVAELRQGSRLGLLEAAGDEQAGVRAAFALSYTALAAETRRYFRLLGLAPGPDVTVPAAAALAGTTPELAGRQLDRLAGVYLVDQPAAGRYSLHDLLRWYARERSEAEDAGPDRAAATARLLDHLLHTADRAARLLYPHMQRLDLPPAGTDVPVTAFADGTAAMAWLDAERPTLVAAVLSASADGPRPAAWLLADALRGYFWLRRHTVDWVAVAGAAIDAARRDGDARGEAAGHISLAQAHRVGSRHRAAIEHYTLARALTQRAGWLEGEAAVLGSLANVYRDQGLAEESLDYHGQAMAIYRRTGNRAGEAVSLGNLGNGQWELGRLAEAGELFARALDAYREVGSRSGEAHALNGLGNVALGLGELDAALDHLGAALVIHRAAGSREGEADTLNNLAEAHREAGRHAEALDLAGTALALATDAGDRRVEIDARNTLGTVHSGLRRPADAVEQHREALRLAEEAGYRRGVVTALTGLAAALLAAGAGPAEALEPARRALALAERAGFRVLEAQARDVLSAIEAG